MSEEVTNKTKRAFMRAFSQLYEQKPLNEISIQAIADRAGYNRSTFYQYFFDLEDVLNEVEEEQIARILANLHSSAGREDIVKSALFTYKGEDDYSDALLGKYGAEHFLHKLRGRLKPWIDARNIAGDPLEEYLIQYRIDTSLSMFQLWIERGRDLPFEELAQLIADLSMHGLSGLQQ